jgi:hypothetical protein
MASSLGMADASLCDGKLLRNNVDCVWFGGDKFNVQIRLGKEKLINAAFKEFLSYKSWDDGCEIVPDVKDGRLETKARIVRGSHPSLKYRGNELKRHKVWFQKEGRFYYVYKYTGWQHSVLPATFRVDKTLHPNIWKLVQNMEKVCPQNHWIMTCYENGDDYIGAHSDKTKNWVEGSSFHVRKWGHPRRFVITLKSDDIVIFDKILPSGTDIFVDAETNLKTRHAVPTMPNMGVGISGSIVGRHIATKVTFEEAKKNIALAKKSKQSRDRAKEARKLKRKKLKPEEGTKTEGKLKRKRKLP